MMLVAIGSDRLGELVERGCDSDLFAERVDAEFVAPASEVRHERVPSDHDGGGAVGLQAAHRSQPGSQPAVVALDAVVIGYDFPRGFGSVAVLLGSRVRWSGSGFQEE